MKLGVSMWSYVRPWQAGELDIPGFVAEAKRAGAEGVELLDFFYRDPDRDRPEAIDALASAGLPCATFSVSNNFAQADPAVREQQADRIRFGVDEALAYGAKVVRVFAGDVREGGPGLEEATAWIVEGLAHAADYARDRGVRLALENHGKLAGRSDQVRAIVDAVRQKCGHDALGANPDTGNFVLVKQASHEALADVAGIAAMVHFKDFAPVPTDYAGFAYEALDGTKFAGTAVGEGAVDLRACVAALKAGGFDGWMNVEYEGEESPFAAVPRSIANARSMLA